MVNTQISQLKVLVNESVDGMLVCCVTCNMIFDLGLIMMARPWQLHANIIYDIGVNAPWTLSES